jgi:hypothetical protein
MHVIWLLSEQHIHAYISDVKLNRISARRILDINKELSLKEEHVIFASNNRVIDLHI